MNELKSLNFASRTRLVAKYTFFAILVGILSGSASAFFLISLKYVTTLRSENLWLIAFLPIGGFIIGWIYYKYGKRSEGGNDLIIKTINYSKERLPWMMAPLVLFGTLATHLFGGSAGREGTAVQMGGSLADQITRWYDVSKYDRKILILMGVSGGFSSVFGTPLAGTIFALEMSRTGRISYSALIPCLLAAIIADFITITWGVGHTSYQIALVPSIDPMVLIYAIAAGILFGVIGWTFSFSKAWFGNQFKTRINYPPMRLFWGGVIIALSFAAISTDRYAGLGIPVIVSAFQETVPVYDFIAKLFFTTFTLGAGFKGGEVTPLFFIGATAGNAFSQIIPLPISLLAGMGFVAVFSGATNTPLASTIMGIELFGAEAAVFLGIACMVAYLFSGKTSVYSAQEVAVDKLNHSDDLTFRKKNG
ncbi:MAG: voltage-gated chloride channel family protein [Cyclobacteriaceae bacterium]|nr:voltage-gated chloride channel family protein [Cyclobacteriaceae bacterium]MCH8516613.1 voltage-gated chloride channel family protein [Cyclobacteriaceae bacterium]